MTGFRRAFILASADRYFATVVNIVSLPILARLLNPEEYGITVLCGFILALAEPLRELGSQAYLIQERELTREKVRTAFTINAIVTALLATLIWAASGRIADFYGKPELIDYFEVALLGFLVGPFFAPIFALLRREMAFGTIALINVTSATLYAVLAISLAASGFSFMSFAYATLATAISGVAMGLLLRGEAYMFRPSLAATRDLLRFGVFETVAAVLEKTWENFPYLLFGRFYGAESVGLYQRANLICTLPERVALQSVASVSLPALSARFRDGSRDIGVPFRRMLACMTAVHWPAMVCLALLAHPVVLVMLGERWTDAVPIVQTMALAMLLNIPAGLVYPTLAAVGGIRYGAMIFVVFVPIGALIFAVAALQGVIAATASLALAFLLKSVVSIHFVRRYCPFTWSDLLASQMASAIVALAAGAGPAAILLYHGTTRISIAAGVFGGVLALIGFVIALRATAHPLHLELAPLAARLRDHIVATYPADRVWGRLLRGVARRTG